MNRVVDSGAEESAPLATEVVFLEDSGFDWSFNCGGCCVGCSCSEVLKQVVGESLHEQRKEHWVSLMLGGTSASSGYLVPGFGEPICCRQSRCNCDQETLEGEGSRDVDVFGPVPPIMESEVASRTGIRALFESVRDLESTFRRAQSVADLARVASMCQESLSAAANVVVRLHPDQLNGVDTQNPAVAIHVLDTFFGSRIGNNLDEPSRRMIRTTLVLTYDIQTGGFQDRGKATISVESVRFIVASLLLLV
jgi:hypothetical protein